MELLTLSCSPLPFTGAVGQLLDSLEEIQMLAGANEEDIAFLQHFFEDHSLQSLLEVSDETLCFGAGLNLLTDNNG